MDMINHVRAVIIIPATLLFICLPGGVRAQSASGAFETISVGLGPTLQLNRTILDDAWESPWGIAGFVETPFYFGRVQAGVEFLPYAGLVSSVPDFNVFHFYMDWRALIPLPWKLHSSNGFRLGLFQYHFDDENAGVHQRVERELCASFVTGIQHDFTEKWTIRLTASFGTVFLSEPVRQVFITVSLSRSFISPVWLQDLLK